MRKLRAAALALALFAAPAIAGVQPGKWEFTVDVSLAQGAGPSGPIVETRCVSEEEARDPRKVMEANERPGCVFSDTQDTGSDYTFSVDCRNGPVPVHGNGRVHYTEQTLDGTIDLIAEQPNLRIVTHSSVKGRRLGSCNS